MAAGCSWNSNPISPVGGLLGDVFLHLLPETYQHVRSQWRLKDVKKDVQRIIFLIHWSFISICSGDRLRGRGWIVQDWSCHAHWGSCLPCSREGSPTTKSSLTSFTFQVLEMSNPETNLELREKENKKIVGYLNLLANCTDNLLHGLAVDWFRFSDGANLSPIYHLKVGSSFLSSSRLGITTTAAILLHEVRIFVLTKLLCHKIYA